MQLSWSMDHVGPWCSLGLQKISWHSYNTHITPRGAWTSSCWLCKQKKGKLGIWNILTDGPWLREALKFCIEEGRTQALSLQGHAFRHICPYDDTMMAHSHSPLSNDQLDGNSRPASQPTHPYLTHQGWLAHLDNVYQIQKHTAIPSRNIRDNRLQQQRPSPTSRNIRCWCWCCRWHYLKK